MGQSQDRLLYAALLILGGMTLAGGFWMRALPARSAAPEKRALEALEAKRNVPKKKAARRARRSHFSRGAQARRRAVFARVQFDEAFQRLEEPSPGDWLWSFRESGQSIAEYALSRPNTKTSERHTLHLQPMGHLTAAQRRVLALVREHTAAFFDVDVEIRQAMPLQRSWYRRQRRQYDASAIVSQLASRVPWQSLGLFALTTQDLYADDLNFVFGLALLKRRAGIYSLARFGGEGKLRRLRALKLSAHEIGHMFGLSHCVFYRCVMNGVNSAHEMDRSPLHLCPVCLAKLKWNLRFDPAARYRRLARLYRAHGFGEQASFVRARVQEVATGH